MIAQALAQEKAEAKGTQDRIESVPFPVREAVVVFLFEAIEIEVLVVALIRGIVVELRV